MAAPVEVDFNELDSWLLLLLLLYLVVVTLAFSGSVAETICTL